QAGVTGEVVASDLTGMMDAIRNQIASNSPSNTQEVRQDRTEDIKVEIPETGVSLGQAWRYLRLWFGHERRLTGSLRDLGDGRIALTATLAGAASFTATGPAADLDKLEQQAAEHVYQQVDPVNYGQYLGLSNRRDEMVAA